MSVLGRGLSPTRFVALLEEFRQKLLQERINARVTEVQQDELIALVKLQAEVRARYLVTVLELIDPKMTDLPARVAEMKHYREMAEEIEMGVKAVIDGLVAKQIPINGLDYGPEYSPDIERAIEEFIEQNRDDYEF